MPEPTAAPGADALASAARAAGRKGPPPVHLWNPPFCGDLDMRIARDGTWFYLGTPIGRAAARPALLLDPEARGRPLLPRDPGGEGRHHRRRRPLRRRRLHRRRRRPRRRRLTFATHVGDSVTAGPEHPIRVEPRPGTASPRPTSWSAAASRRSSTARASTASPSIGCEHEVDGIAQFGLWSGGAFFPSSRRPSSARPNRPRVDGPGNPLRPPPRLAKNNHDISDCP